MPLYAALPRVRRVIRRPGANWASSTVRGCGPPARIQFTTSGRSLLNRVSVVPPYSSPKTPHQYQRASFC